MKSNVHILFICIGLTALLVGSFIGCLTALQYIYPDFLRETLPFYVTRPLHVSLVIAWIFAAAIGSIYYYLPIICNINLWSTLLAVIHFLFFICIGLLILLSYINKQFGGREYFEFPPVYAIPIIISWILLLINFFITSMKSIKKWPVYMWMWGTGIVFFLITYCESYFWLIPYFGNNVIRDVTVQWKSYGSLIGSWNMLVYGIAFYLMEKIKDNYKIGISHESFFFYFLALFNLMFGWGHHTYVLPAAPWIRHVSYLVSMTELIVLAKIIWDWKKTLVDVQKYKYILPYWFLLAGEVWIFLNLVLAIIISIPIIHIYTHGTHITVAHAMGSTIGINTMILLASVFYIIQYEQYKEVKIEKSVKIGLGILNISLMIFWIALIFAGINKGILQVSNNVMVSFNQIMSSISVYLQVVALSGILLFVGFLLVTIPAIRIIFLKLFS